MKLDRTRIVIRERSQAELLDLALQIGRQFWYPLAGCMLVVGAPFAVLNYWLIGDLAVEQIDSLAIGHYLWAMSLLVYLQAPLAGCLVTAYLGRITFYRSATWRELLSDIAGLGGRLAWTHLFWRGVGISLILAWPYNDRDIMNVLLPTLVLFVFALRSYAPYMNELIILERVPVLKRANAPITLGQRSRNIHQMDSSGFVHRGCVTPLVCWGLGTAVLGVGWFAAASVSGDWSWGAFIVHILAPGTMWMLAIYMAVVRFLCYLDRRIRSEGWEVELAIRAGVESVISS